VLGLGDGSNNNDFCPSKRVNLWGKITQYIFFQFASSTATFSGHISELRVELQAFRQSSRSPSLVSKEKSEPEETAQELEKAEACG
jgi:hypothetical protein